MMGGQGNKLSRSDGIDMSLGLITTPNDLKQLKAKEKNYAWYRHIKMK